MRVFSDAGLEPSSETFKTLMCALAEKGDLVNVKQVRTLYPECKDNLLIVSLLRNSFSDSQTIAQVLLPNEW